MEFFRALSLLALTTDAVYATVKTTTYETVLGTATIAPEPRGRGTFGILFSCSATFFFCVWTAVHPNTIPGLSPGNRVSTS